MGLRGGYDTIARDRSGIAVLASLALLCAVLGSIHAFSVFLEPLETAFGLNRSTVSLTYSLALAALTLAVLFGPTAYTAVSPGQLVLAVGIIAAMGAMLAGLAGGIVVVWVGYSACFGIANGLGYGFALQYAARANPQRPGMAMGIVTAAYAFGAALSPFVFVVALNAGGFFAAMATLAIVVLLAAILAALVLAKMGIAYRKSVQTDHAAMPPGVVIIRLWLAYGTGVATGLMVIGHAAGFGSLLGISPWIAPTLLAICNLFGSLAGGHLVDRFSHRLTLTLLPLLSFAALVALAIFPPLTLVCLGTLGFAYGGTIAAYPAVIAHRFPGDAGPRVYGKVFTAWGTAGVMVPWMAGFLFDQSQNYLSAIWLAAVLAALSAILAGRAIR